MKLPRVLIRKISELIKRIKFWWEIPDFLARSKKKGSFHIKFFDKINVPSEKVKEKTLKQQKELHIYLEEEELSLLSDLNNSRYSQICHDFPLIFWFLSPVYLLLFFSLLLFPIVIDCVLIKENNNENLVACSYESILKSPISHSFFFKVILFFDLKSL